MQADGAAGAIEELKQLLDVRTDGALADALGLQKTAVAQWRRRGAVPAHIKLQAQDVRRRLAALPVEQYDDAFPAVVGEHALMLACVLTPSRTDLAAIGQEGIISDLAECATWFSELRVAAALALTRRMRLDAIGVQAAFQAILASTARLDAIKAAALSD